MRRRTRDSRPMLVSRAMTSRRLFVIAPVCFAACFVVPRTASAQWYVSGYLGGNHTHDATVAIRVPDLTIDFHDVQFAAQPTVPRRYYGVRIGRMGGSDRRLGFELELIHMKALADVDRTYDVTLGSGSVLPPGAAAPMSRIVSEYQMTHGLNLCFVNAVFRRPLSHSDRLSLMLRAGGGPTVPHAESTVLGQVKHQYEFGGFGAQGAAGLQFQLPYRLAIVSEYKLTYARPKIDLAQGTGWMSALTHHVVVGIAIGLSK